MERKTFNAFNDTPRGKHWLVDTPSTTRTPPIDRDKSIKDKVDAKFHYSNIFANGFSSAISVNDESTVKSKLQNDTIRKEKNINISQKQDR